MPVPPAVNVEVGHHDCVQGSLLYGPVKHGLEPRGLGRQPHPGVRPHGSIGQLQRVVWRQV